MKKQRKKKITDVKEVLLLLLLFSKTVAKILESSNGEFLIVLDPMELLAKIFLPPAQGHFPLERIYI